MKTLLGTALAASLLLLAGCAKDMGEEFVGKWVNAKAPKNVLSIEHNGESFIIRDTRPELFGNGVKTKNYPAVLRGDVLQVSNGVGTINYAIDQSTGNLSTGESGTHRSSSACLRAQVQRQSQKPCRGDLF